MRHLPIPGGRASYAGILLDIGNVDEALRQLNATVQRDSHHALA